LPPKQKMPKWWPIWIDMWFFNQNPNTIFDV
jgi:hypothetical protein